MTFDEFLGDDNLGGLFLAPDPETWTAWRTVARAIGADPPAAGDLDLFRQCTGRSEWPDFPAAEAWIIAGRRSGKSFTVALLATYLAACREYPLAAGEVGHVIIVSPTREQAGIILKYISGFFEGSDLLRPLIVRETRDTLELANRVTISVFSSDFRSLRGFTAVAAIVDEIAFLQVEGSRPDHEVIRALRPALATTGGPLIAISSPYAKQGSLYSAWRAHYGRDRDPVVVWQAPSLVMNPTLSRDAIDRARDEDPEGSSAEWDAQFRADIESFVSREAVDDCVVLARHELPYLDYNRYVGFVDPSGGSGDSFTLAVAHEEKGVRILDLLRERRPPFSPEAVVEEYCEILKAYRIALVEGDHYAGQWPREQFEKRGITYIPSDRPKSALYGELLPLLNSGRVELLDHERMVGQLVRLERRTSRAGKDSIDHPPHGHDDLANAMAGAIVLARDIGPLDFGKVILFDPISICVDDAMKEPR